MEITLPSWQPSGSDDTLSNGDQSHPVVSHKPLGHWIRESLMTFNTELTGDT